jgi:hypothetical protein
MYCVFCKREVPPDMEVVVREGWIPDYYEGRDWMEGPVCPECGQKHLWLRQDGEYEPRVPKKVAHK